MRRSTPLGSRKHKRAGPMFRVWCEVWGGVTGPRQAYLKSNGEISEFSTREEAEKEAARLNEKMNGSPHRIATFRYSVLDAGQMLADEETSMKAAYHRNIHKL